MSPFLELLVGNYSNKRQAQAHPTRFAHIHVKHVKIGENRIYGEQKYNYLLERPYRQFVIEAEEAEGEVTLKNYEIEDEMKVKFVDGKNLDQLTEDMLTYREGCDIILKNVGPDAWEGGTSTCECWVQWGTQQTYVQNQVLLTKDFYEVKDLGLSYETNQKVWGSDYGAFKFARA